MTSAVDRSEQAPAAARPAQGRAAILRKNSLASALRAASTSLTTVLLPIVLVLALPDTTYAIWALMFSIAAFTLYFDLGAQASVMALVGRADAEGDDGAAVAAGRAGLRVAAAVGTAATLVGIGIGAFLESLFPSIPSERLVPAAVTLVLLFLGQGLSLVGTALASYFAGRQRTASATAVLVPARFASMGLTAVAAFAGADLVVLGIAFVVPLAVGVAVLGLRFLAEARRAPSVSGVGVRRLLRFSGTLMLWNVCMLVVSGVDLTIVGRLDFAHVAMYSVASTVAVGIAGLDNAVLAPLLPEMSGRNGRGDLAGTTRLLSLGTRLNAVVLAGALAAVAALAPVLVGILIGDADPATAGSVVIVLTAANVLRLTLAPLSLGFIARGTHTRLVVQPLMETVANLVSSILLGAAFGAVGVAAGTLIGAAVGVVVGSTWSLRSAGVGLIGGTRLMEEALIRPLVAWVPAGIAIALVWILGIASTPVGVGISLIGVAASLPLALFVLGADGRRPLRRFLPARLR